MEVMRGNRIRSLNPHLLLRRRPLGGPLAERPERTFKTWFVLRKDGERYGKSAGEIRGNDRKLQYSAFPPYNIDVMMRGKAIRYVKAGLKGILQSSSISFNLLQSPSISFNLLVVVLIVLLFPSTSVANVLKIEVPSWITDSMLLNGDPVAYDTLKKITKRVVESLPSGEFFDVVIFTREGEIINLTPYTDSTDFSHLSDTSFSPDFMLLQPCRGLGWSDAQWDSLLNTWNDLYYTIKTVYGYPLHPQLVRVSNADSVRCSLVRSRNGLYCPPFGYTICRLLCDPLPLSPCDAIPGLKGIIYTPYSSASPVTLSHEMVHAFRGLWVVKLYPHYEEGHAQAVEVEVSNRLGYRHPGKFHSGRFYPFQQFWNQRFIAAPNALTFQWSLAVNHVFRYNTSGYLWWKVYKENPNFFYIFNTQIRSRNPLIPRTWSELYLMASLSALSVEGVWFPIWFAAQPMFNILPTPGRYLEIIPSFRPNISIYPFYLYILNFRRNFLGDEVGERSTLRIKIWNSTGDLTVDSIVRIDALDDWFSGGGSKYLRIMLNPSCQDTIKTHNGFRILQYERFKIEASLMSDNGVADCGIYDEKYVGFIKWDTIPDGSNFINLAGAVSSELEVDVRINDTTVRSRCGVFYLLGQEDGTYRISYNSRFAAPRTITITKDKAFYHVYPITRSLDRSIPPIRPKGLRVDSVLIEDRRTVLVIHVYLRWNRNNDCDTRGYKIYRAIDWGSGPLVFHSVDSTAGTTYHDEVPIAAIDPAYPRVYYFITAYDEDHAYAQNESMPSDTLLAFDPFTALKYNTRMNDHTRLNTKEVKVSVNGRKVVISGKGYVEIYDVSGRLIDRFNADGKREVELKRGVYMFRVNGKLKKEVIR